MVVNVKTEHEKKGVIATVREMEDVYCGTKKLKWQKKKILCSDVSTEIFLQNATDKVDRQDILLFLNYFLNIPDEIKIAIQYQAGTAALSRSFRLEGYMETLQIGSGVPLVLQLNRDGIEYFVGADRRVKTLFFPLLVKERELGIHLKKSVLPAKNSFKIERSVKKRMDFDENTYYEMNYTTISKENNQNKKVLDLKFQLQQRPTLSMEEMLYSFLATTPMEDLTEENCLSYILSNPALIEQPCFLFHRPEHGEFLEFQNGTFIHKELYQTSNDSLKKLALTFRK